MPLQLILFIKIKTKSITKFVKNKNIAFQSIKYKTGHSEFKRLFVSLQIELFRRSEVKLSLHSVCQ